jgi:FAD/FMN-containing dehydrogenase
MSRTAAPATAQELADLKQTLARCVGEAQVRDDAAAVALFSQDIGAPGSAPVCLVVAPGSVDELSAVAAAATAAGFALAPRGAGMSYTAGYVPAHPRTVALDMTRMSAVLAVNEKDMTVTVQAGCSWLQLLTTLSAKGLRTPFWGPMSGITSTVGGGVSQLNAMLGAGQHGTSSESVIAMTVVLADGRVLRTGARGADGQSPFYRHFGPDIAGLFCGDCGALGVKAEITLRLMRNPAHEGYASFSFKSGADLLGAMAEVARAGLASEMCAFDPGLTQVRMTRESMASDLKKAAAVVGKQKSLMKGLVAVGRMALAGRDFIGEDDYSLHLIAEGRCAAAVDFDLSEARRIAAQFSGKEIANTIARVIRAQPFPAANSILGPAGERWLPIHGQVPLSAAPDVFAGVQGVFSSMAQAFAQHGIHTGYLFSSMSTNALIIEPVFYWPDERAPVHEAAIEPAHLARLPVLPPNPAARAVVLEAKAKVIDVYRRHGCGHFQIGRTYPYRASREPASWAFLEAIKREVDPLGLMNPGVLGFDAPQGA